LSGQSNIFTVHLIPPAGKFFIYKSVLCFATNLPPDESGVCNGKTDRGISSPGVPGGASIHVLARMFAVIAGKDFHYKIVVERKKYHYIDPIAKAFFLIY